LLDACFVTMIIAISVSH